MQQFKDLFSLKSSSSSSEEEQKTSSASTTAAAAVESKISPPSSTSPRSSAVITETELSITGASASGNDEEAEKESLMDKTADSMRNLKSKIGGAVGDAADMFGIKMPVNLTSGGDEPPQEQTVMEELDEMTSLTWHQRLTGFGMCFGMGVLFILLAIFLFLPVIALFPQKFAFFYSVGSLFCVCSTAFLVGMKKQMTMMFESHRAEAAGAYFLFLILTMIAAVKMHSYILSFVFGGCQIAACAWYCLSYIPYARQTLSYFSGYIIAALKPCMSAMASCCTSCTKMVIS